MTSLPGSEHLIRTELQNRSLSADDRPPLSRQHSWKTRAKMSDTNQKYCPSIKAHQRIFMHESENVCVHAYLCINSESLVRMSSLGTEPLSLSAFRFQTKAKVSPTSWPSFWMRSTRNWPVQHTAELKKLFNDIFSFWALFCAELNSMWLYGFPPSSGVLSGVYRLQIHHDPKVVTED